MNVVIYARYSSHNQTEQSIEGQISVCKEYAKRNNLTIIDEYIDRALSGTSDNRPQFLKMIDDSSKHNFNGVLVYQLDRFARNRYDSATYKAKLRKNNVRVLSARENISDDASGVLMESVLEGMAEYFSAELSQKVKRGMSLNASKYLYNGGTIPLGFIVNDKKEYVIDEEKAFIIIKIFEMYNNGYKMSEIIEFLNNHNYKTCKGNVFNKCSIRSILLNKKYNGIYSYNGTETQNAIPKIISDEDFNLAQEIMIKNKKAPARSRAKNNYLLTTKLFCGYCNEMLIGISGTSKNKRLYSYYSCNGLKKKVCLIKPVPKSDIEDVIVNEIRKILTTETINLIANKVVELSKLEQENTNLKLLNKQLRNIQKQKSNLMNSLKLCEDDNIKKTIFDELSKMNQETKVIEKDIILEERKFLKITFPQVKFFLNTLKKGNVNDLKYRKLLIDVLVNKIYLYKDELIIVFNTQSSNIKINIPTKEELECSFNEGNALP